MKIIFLGVGEAFDENNSCTSILIESKTNILLDCGFTTPYQLWKYNTNPNFLDAIYISHFHADHYFGIPAIFQRAWEYGRTKPFTIIGQKGAKEQVEKLLQLGYKNFLPKYKFPINYIEVENKENIKFNDLILEFLEIKHSSRNFAIKISDNGKTIFYSGDGELSEEKKFYYNLDLLIQETYLLDVKKEGHTNLMDLIKFVKDNKIKLTALVHLNRDFAKDKEKILKIIRENNVNIILPENLQVVKL
ncbi:MAG: ribonuclease Z [Candidatus Aenigmatarchaeota archaeon]